MGYKPRTRTVSFSELEFSSNQSTNKTLTVLSTINTSISWHPIELTLLSHYPVGKKKAGTPAYSPLLLFKALLLKQWFSIKSDADLQSQINDRLSFKSFLGLSMTDSSPAGTTFARFRSRLSPVVMKSVVANLREQLSTKGLGITHGSAVDPRVAPRACKQNHETH